MAVATQELTQPIVRRTFTVDQDHAMGDPLTSRTITALTFKVDAVHTTQTKPEKKDE